MKTRQHLTSHDCKCRYFKTAVFNQCKPEMFADSNNRSETNGEFHHWAMAYWKAFY